eukprot:GHRR01005592.1.p1 GENE.GHRR01005592.1~~GHRR01005592.1.p1  ORF type:complete len:281 (+),score=82.55 GHRR01005592.1:191-1033(+)
MLRARQKHTCGLESVCAVATAVAVLVCLGTLTLPPVVAQQQSNESTLAASNTSSNTTAGSGGSCCEQIQSLRFSSNIPVMVIQLSGTRQVAGATAADLQLQTKGPYLPATMCTCGAGADDVESIAAEIKVRGSSSARDYAKKSFAVNTLDQITSFGQSKKKDYPLLGLPSDSDWVLYGPENDRTLGMRNWLAYGLARQMGRYASRTRYMELFLNTVSVAVSCSQNIVHKQAKQLLLILGQVWLSIGSPGGAFCSCTPTAAEARADAYKRHASADVCCAPA